MASGPPFRSQDWDGCPRCERMTLTFAAVLVALSLTGWFAAWLTRLPVWRLVRRNVLLGSTIMVASILAGLALH